jgi:hypothetical protein
LKSVTFGAVLHPTVLFALADGAYFQQHGEIVHPRSVRIASGLSFVFSIEIVPAKTNPSDRRSVPGG